MVEKMEAEKIFDKELPQKQLNNLAKYFVSLPSEVAMKLWAVMGAGEENIKNTLGLHKAKVKGKEVRDYFVKILGG